VLAHYNGRKMVALSESGTLPNAEMMDTYGVAWSYFSLWKDGFLDDFTPQQVQALLHSERVITLDELPIMPWSLSAPALGDFNQDSIVDASDYVVWRRSLGQNGVGLAADSDLNGIIDYADYDFWRSQFGQGAISGTEIGSSSSKAALPEATTSVMFLTGMLAMFLRRGDVFV
jgi:hypothetical protein